WLPLLEARVATPYADARPSRSNGESWPLPALSTPARHDAAYRLSTSTRRPGGGGVARRASDSARRITSGQPLASFLPMPAGTARSAPGSLSLPVVAAEASAPRVRRSRSAARRWTVLVAVQLLMIAHVLAWIWFGRTTTPVEPSESMEAVKRGVINAGTIFF